jgi:hypothetical protein
MNSEPTISVLLVGVLVYKTLDLFILKEKVRQTFLRRNRLTSDCPLLSGRLSKTIETLNEEFSTVVLCYFLATGLLLGLILIVAQSQGVEHYLTAKVVSAVTLVASIFQASLAIVVEHYRTLLEGN